MAQPIRCASQFGPFELQKLPCSTACELSEGHDEDILSGRFQLSAIGVWCCFAGWEMEMWL